jgi:enamine deaminase RidA (YjgF/YER057c/UK114 family)
MPKQTQSRIENKVLSCGPIDAVCSKVILPTRTETVLTACGQDAVGLEQWLHDELMVDHIRPVSRFVFAGEPYFQALGKAYLKEDGTLLRHKEAGLQEGGISSVQATAITGVELFGLRQDGRNVGVVYEDDDARYCRLSGVIPLDLTASREAQTRAVLEMLDWMLVTNGFQFTDTVRTWFYLDHLLDWYKGFNEVRTRFFEERGVFHKLVPASTGIGAANPWGAALTCDLLAIQPKSANVRIAAVPSPLQNPALDYASSFSRAVEIQLPSCRSLLISGTASIDPAGKTQYEGDTARQIERTLDVVAALLESRGMTWGDVTRGIAYFADITERAAFNAIWQSRGLPVFPLALSHADVCRHDLLFELEVDAVKV